MTTPAPAKGGPQVLIFMIIGLGPAFLLGYLTGAGPAALVGAFVALFGLMTASGGPLRPDLRRLMGFAPLMVVAAVVPRLLGEVSRPAAFALMTVIVIVAALLPLRGPRFTTVGLGLGMVTLLAYGIPLMGAVNPGQLVLAAAVGLVAAVVLRMLMGIADPHAATRSAVGGAFDQPEPGLTAAFDLWLADGRRQWLGDALVSASRYRVALGSAEALARRLPEHHRSLADTALEQARTRAGRVADLIRAKSPDAVGDEGGDTAETTTFATPPAGVAELVTDIEAALDRAERVAHQRDGGEVEVPREQRRLLRLDVFATAVRLRSIQLRHAARTGLGVLIVLLISLRLRQGDPLMPTLLLTTFGILQASWQETLTKARPRILGLVIGIVVVLAIVLFVPTQAMTPIALIALVIALWNLTARPVVGYAALLCMSVGINSSLRHLDPTATLVEYGTLTVLALVVGVVVGFAVIPGVRRRSLPERIDDATAATARSIRSLLRSHVEDPSAARAKVLVLHRDAALARGELVPDHDRLTDSQIAELDELRVGLRDLTSLSVVAVSDPDTECRGVERALAVLESREDRTIDTEADTGPRRGGEPAHSRSALVDEALVALADEVGEARKSLAATLPPAVGDRV